MIHTGVDRPKLHFTLLFFKRMKLGRRHVLLHHMCDDACLVSCTVFRFIWRSDVRSCHQSCAIFDQVPTFVNITCWNLHSFLLSKKEALNSGVKEVCVCVWRVGGGGRRTGAMLVFISINLRNFYSRFCVQQYIITNFLAKIPSGLLRTEFWDLTYKVRRYELPQFVSPFINP